MSGKNNIPVRVTGEERSHPRIRQLARFCIELARLRREQHQPSGRKNQPAPAPKPDEEGVQA